MAVATVVAVMADARVAIERARTEAATVGAVVTAVAVVVAAAAEVVAAVVGREAAEAMRRRVRWQQR